MESGDWGLDLCWSDEALDTFVPWMSWNCPHWLRDPQWQYSLFALLAVLGNCIWTVFTYTRNRDCLWHFTRFVVEDCDPWAGRVSNTCDQRPAYHLCVFHTDMLLRDFHVFSESDRLFGEYFGLILAHFMYVCMWYCVETFCAARASCLIKDRKPRFIALLPVQAGHEEETV